MLLESNVFKCYTELNFPRGKGLLASHVSLRLILLIAVQAISRFANVTLSSLYFDITKDILYASRPESTERRAVESVLLRVPCSESLKTHVSSSCVTFQVLDRLTMMLAPLTPHLAEEIFYYRNGGVGDKSEGPSAFTQKWTLMVCHLDFLITKPA